MKKLVNEVGDIVPEMLEGLVAFDPSLNRLPGWNVVVRADARKVADVGGVALVSGGGAGHEPAHAGYVGPGMLSAAVVGEVFTSPSVDAVLAAIRAVAGPGGVLLIVKNYTGDRLNFGLAAELARADGTAVEMVVVADDVALAAGGAHAGRRGIAGTVLVHKIAGAAAAAGRDLVAVRDAAQAAVAALGTMGVAFGACTVPAVGVPGFELGEDEIEWGLGIHGESGVEKTAIEPADDIVKRLLDLIIADLGLTDGARVALLVNNLGGSSVSELGVVARAAVRHLRARRVDVVRGWTGTFLTALEMPGCSLSLLALDDDRIAYLDAPASTTAWPCGRGVMAPAGPDHVEDHAAPGIAPQVGPFVAPDSSTYRVLERVCAVLTASESELTRLDQVVGDGDLGVSLARGVRAIRAERDGYPARSDHLLRAMSATVRRAVGGTSGPLYAVMLLRAGVALQDLEHPSPADWVRAFEAAVDGLVSVGGAEPGDRTMLDALRPAVDAVGTVHGSSSVDLDAAVTAAEAGARATAQMSPRLGRSSYLGDRVLGHVDPGARAVVLWLTAIRDALAG